MPTKRGFSYYHNIGSNQVLADDSIDFTKLLCCDVVTDNGFRKANRRPGDEQVHSVPLV